jgi:ubiquinone/menaquinone biosynthesis C-methylase UbiE
MRKENSFFTEANRLAWNCAMPYHKRAMDEKWDKILADKNGISQTEPELTALKQIGIKDKSIVHLCCNNGIELMSLKRLGAAKCVGFDICDEAIQDANRRSGHFNIRVEFHRCSVYNIPQEFDECFDIVYITIGALTWLPSLQDFFGVVRRLLKRDGVLFIHEQHPFMNVLPWDIAGDNAKPTIENNYFNESYLLSQEGLDYYSNESYQAPDTYEFTHTLSDIVNSIIANNMSITRFDEYEHDISNGLGWIKNTGLRLPLCYILTAKAV